MGTGEEGGAGMGTGTGSGEEREKMRRKKTDSLTYDGRKEGSK